MSVYLNTHMSFLITPKLTIYNIIDKAVLLMIEIVRVFDQFQIIYQMHLSF
jgi:hypothetical protein